MPSKQGGNRFSNALACEVSRRRRRCYSYATTTQYRVHYELMKRADQEVRIQELNWTRRLGPMSVALARLLLDDHHDIPPAPLAAPPAPYGAPPVTPQVEEEGEEAEQQDEAADEAAVPSFSCLALWNWRPNRLRRSPARVGHRCLSRHRCSIPRLSSAEGARYAGVAWYQAGHARNLLG